MNKKAITVVALIIVAIVIVFFVKDKKKGEVPAAPTSGSVMPDSSIPTGTDAGALDMGVIPNTEATATVIVTE